MTEMPVFWEEALRASANELPEAMPDLVELLKTFVREEFVEFVHTDEHVSDSDRAAFLDLIDRSPEPAGFPVVLRNMQNDGKPLEFRID